MLRVIALMLVIAAPLAAQAPPAGDSPELRRGKLLYIQCRACHELEAGQPHKVGPNLTGFLGRPAGTAEGFSYSPAFRKVQLTWNEQTLDRWLEKPSAVVPGNTMAFAGIANPKDRAALIAYLKAETRPAK